VAGPPAANPRSRLVQCTTPLLTLENFFLGCWGRFQSFSFTDPDNAVTYSDVRFDSDSLEIHHESIGVSSLSVRLLETNEVH
jgi:hypothetical protein